VFTTAKDKNFNNTLAKAVEQDFKTALIATGWPGAAAVVRAVRQPCKDITVRCRLGCCRSLLQLCNMQPVVGSMVDSCLLCAVCCIELLKVHMHPTVTV
jgi:hypothetical protein